MYVTTVDFEMKILEARGNAHEMLSVAMDEYLRLRKDIKDDFHRKQVILAGDIGILAGRFSEDPSTFLARFYEDILNA